MSLSLYLSIFICPKKQYGNHIQRTGQRDHNGTEHCPICIKMPENSRLRLMISGQLGNEIKIACTIATYKCMFFLTGSRCCMRLWVYGVYMQYREGQNGGIWLWRKHWFAAGVSRVPAKVWSVNRLLPL